MTTHTSSPQRRNSEDIRYRRLFRRARAVVVAVGAAAGAGRHGRRHAGADAADQVLLEEEVVGLPLAARAHGVAQAGDAGEEDEEAGLVGDHQVPLRVGALGEGAVGGGGAAEEAVFDIRILLAGVGGRGAGVVYGGRTVSEGWGSGVVFQVCC